MFILSKLVGYLTQPLLWVFALLFAGVVLQRSKPALARRLLWGALLLMLCMGWIGPPEWILHRLESKYTEMPLDADLRGYTGVVVLGGANASGLVQQAHMQPLLGSAAERMTTPVAMLLRYPHLRVVFTGGEGMLFGSGPSEADRAKMFFDSMGLTGGKVEYESVSRNTFENAVLTARLPGIDKTQRWLLITSAYHMPRSMATFAKAGWNVTAYPVDFITGAQASWTNFSFPDSADRWELALRELVGLVAYKFTGRL
jgi:uncharacterized SAM-binding protein YcdF (DUF218 family)